MTADGRVFGLVEPDRGAFREADRLLLNGIAFYSELPAGTRQYRVKKLLTLPQQLEGGGR